MTLRNYLTSVGIATLATWVLVSVIVLSVNPFAAQPAVLAVFYLTLFLALSGTFALIGFVLRLGLLRRDRLVSFQVFVSFRQAVLLAALSILLLFLRSVGRLNWVSLTLSLIGLTALEFLFISVGLKRR